MINMSIPQKEILTNMKHDHFLIREPFRHFIYFVIEYNCDSLLQ